MWRRNSARRSSPSGAWVTIVFFVTRLVGDPVALLLPVGASPEQMQALTAALGLDKPLWQQYLTFFWQVMGGDFGQSFQFNRPAMEVVLERMPATIQLALVAIVLGTVIGGLAGSIAATRRGSVIEFVVMTLALLGQATPVFWLGIMLILLFAVDLGWLPTAAMARPAIWCCPPSRSPSSSAPPSPACCAPACWTC